MKISRIVLENFRQFKDEVCIDFDTDGKITVSKANNGVGKSTLLQAFKWVITGNIDFEKKKSSNDYAQVEKLYNLRYDRELNEGQKHTVKGVLYFENDGVEYKLERNYTFVRIAKGLSNLVDRSVVLTEKNKTLKSDEVCYDSKIIERTLENIIPKALIEYFFFDADKNDINHFESKIKLKNPHNLYGFISFIL